MRFGLALIVLMLSCQVSVAQIDLYNGLLGCYPFNGNANDNSGKENHGLVSGPFLTTDRFGNANSAYNFDGHNDFISISAASLKNPSYSYAVWAKVSTALSTGNSGIVFSIGDEFNSKHQTINVSKVYANDGFVGWNVGGYNDGLPTTTSLQSGVMPIIGTWYHLAVTRDDSQMKMYINGVLITSGPTYGNPPYYGSSTKALLGLRCNFTQPFDGAVDDFVIYDRVLSEDEIKALYNSGVPCTEVYVNNVSRCGEGIVSITAYGAADFRWYSKTGEFLYQGNPYVSPGLSESTSFYVSGINGGHETEKKEVEVIIFEPVQFTQSLPDQVKTGESNEYTVEMMSGESPFTILWDFDPDNILSSSAGTFYTYDDFGPRTIRTVVTDINGCQYSLEKTIDVVHEPACEDVTVCVSGQVNLTAQGGTSFRWYDAEVDGVLLYEGNPFSFKANDSNSTLFVAAVNERGESKRKKVLVISKPLPQVIPNFPAEVRMGERSKYAIEIQSGEPPFKISWDFDLDKNVSSEEETFYTFDDFGPRTVRANVTDINGCHYSLGKTIDVVHVPDCEDMTVCGSGPVNLIAQGGTLFRWYDAEVNGVLLYEGNPFEFEVNDLNSTVFVAAVNERGESKRRKVLITSNPLPHIDCRFEEEVEVFQSNSLQVETSLGTPPYRYSWTIGNDSAVNTDDPSYEFKPRRTGQFSAVVEVKDTNGCIASCSESFFGKIDLFIPNVITINNDEKNEVFSLFYRIKGEYFLYEGSDNFLLKVFNRWGMQVFETDNPRKGWHGDQQSPGTYFYLIYLGEMEFTGWVQLIK